MAGEWDVVESKPLSEWDVVATEAAPPPPPPKRKVGGLETALRTVGSAAQRAVGMFDMAAGGLASLFSDAEADRVFRMREERQQSMGGLYAPKADEEMSLGGQIVGGVLASPIELAGGMGVQHGIDRSAQVLDRGGSMTEAGVAGGVSGAANVAANLLPIKVGGALGRGLEGAIAKRIPGAAAPVVGGAVGGGLSGAALGAGADVAVTAAENASLPEGDQFKDLQAEAHPGIGGGLGLAMGAAAGALGARGGARARGLRREEPKAAEPTPGTQGSAGAAGTDLATIREERAAALPVPIKLTKAQKTRKFEDQRFERETAKDPDYGSKLRENADLQNKQVIDNLETFEEMTGRTEPERGNGGRKVVDALEEKAEAKKAEIRKEYTAAREAGELEAPVDTAALVDYLDRNRSSEKNAGVLSTAEAELIRLGGAMKDADGNLVPGSIKLNDVEELRKTIGIGGKKDATNSHFAGELRKLIDKTTEGAGGEIYKGARKKYADYAAEFKNQGVVRDLLALKKNTTDRTVAFDNVFRRIVLSGDPDDLRAVRRSLLDAGENGKQAFRELQGQAIKHLREEATGNAARDSQGRPIVSDAKYAAAIKAMDRDGRLEDLVGKKGAEQLRDVGELLKDIYTAPPGAVNTSNTASVLIKYLADAAVSGFTTGLPVPLIHGAKAAKDYLKSRSLRKKVDEHLGPEGALPATDVKPFGLPEDRPAVSREAEGAAGEAAAAQPGTPEARLEQINALKEGASPETVKVLDDQAKRVQREQRAAQVLEKRTAEADALEKTAAATDDPDLRQALMARAAELRPEKIPTGTATEISPKDGPGRAGKPLPVGEAKELTAEQAAELKPSKRERELQRLRDDTTDPEVQKDLDKAIGAERKRAADQRRGQEYLRLADQAADPGLRSELEAKAKKFGVQREEIPVPEVREIPATPDTVRAVDTLTSDAADEAAWRQVHRFGDLDAKAAKAVAEAITYDAAAVDRAMQQHERSPRVFEREIARIIEEGKSNASKPPEAGSGGKGLEPDPDPPSGGTPAKPREPGPVGSGPAGAQRGQADPSGGPQGVLSELQKGMREGETPVFRVGSGTGLKGRNAGNAQGVAEFLAKGDDGLNPTVGAKGRHLIIYGVKPGEEFGAYSTMNAGRAPGAKSLGKRDAKGSTWYSFPEGAKYQEREIGRIPMQEVRAALKAAGFDSFDDAGSIKGGQILEELAAKHLAKAKDVDIHKQPGLSDAERQVEQRFTEAVQSDPNGFLQRYAELPETQGGKIVNTDEARALWPEYNDSNQSRAQFARAVHEPSSWIAKAQWDKLLAEEPKTNRVLILGGGGGSGKTSSLSDVQPGFADRFDGIYDTTLSSFDKARKSIDQALETGREVTVSYTARDPLESIRNGIIPRANRTGRTVPLEVAAKAHEDAPRVLRELIEHYSDNDKIKFAVVDNTLGAGQAKLIDSHDLPRFNYNALSSRAFAAAKEAYEKGSISEFVYRGLVGEGQAETAARPSGAQEGSGRAGAGEQPEPQRQQGREPPQGQVSRVYKDAPALGDSPIGRETTATTERGTEIPVRYRLVEVDRLVTSHDNDLKPNAAFPGELQPRDRSRDSSEEQISRIENNINPKLLAGGSKASDGAPIVGADGVVESGNARTIAVRRAYDNEKAAKYRTWLIDNAHKYGLTAKQVEGIKRPMLVRQAGGEYDRAEFARQANESAVSSMSETELAQADAKRLPDLEGLSTNDDGSINLAQSSDFVRDFMRVVVGPTERNALMTSDGRLSQRGQARVRNAVFSKAYGDAGIVSMLTESTDANVKNILTGMLRAAPEVARLRELMDAGARPKNDFVPDLVDAVRRFSALREKGMSVEQSVAQGDLMGDGPTPRVVELMKQLESNARAPKRIGEMLKGLVDEVESQGDPRQAGMF